MHLPTTTPLPPPPVELEPAPPLVGVEELQRVALARPDLMAMADRIQTEEVQFALANKEFYPDLEPFVMWDKFMGNMNDRMAPQIGVRLNLPIRQARRTGAVQEAMARIAQRRADLARLTDQVHFEVHQAYEKVRESDQSVRLYEKMILPAARENVKAALVAYTTGKIPFLSLIEAERNLVNLRDRYYETVADSMRRRATLDRVTGGSSEFTQSVPLPESPGKAH
jgi:outer membrane protein TolC